jgi:hypothetical protein
LGDPNSGQQSRALIRDLDQEAREHLFLSAFIFHSADVPLPCSPSCDVGGYDSQSTVGQSRAEARASQSEGVRGRQFLPAAVTPPRAALMHWRFQDHPLLDQRIIPHCPLIPSSHYRCQSRSSRLDCASIVPHQTLPRPAGHLPRSCLSSTCPTSARIFRMPPWPG